MGMNARETTGDGRRRVSQELSSVRECYYRDYKAECQSQDSGGALPHLRNWVKLHFPHDRKAKMCDLGCGRGQLLLAAKQQGYTDLVGVDASNAQVLGRLTDAVQKGDAYEFLCQQPDASFDVLTTYDVIEHLTRGELLELGGEIHRTLRAKGRWLIHAPNAAGIFGSRTRYADSTHECAFTVESLAQLAAVLGFGGIETFEEKPTVHGWRSAARRIIWEVGRLPFLLLWAAETGRSYGAVLSQNITAVLHK